MLQSACRHSSRQASHTVEYFIYGASGVGACGEPARENRSAAAEGWPTHGDWRRAYVFSELAKRGDRGTKVKAPLELTKLVLEVEPPDCAPPPGTE